MKLGKYTKKFKNLYKGIINAYHKNIFRKKCKKYNITKIINLLIMSKLII